MIKVQVGWDNITVMIPIEVLSNKIQNCGVLAEVFDTVLNLVDPGYIDTDEIEELFQEALDRLKERQDVTSD